MGKHVDDAVPQLAEILPPSFLTAAELFRGLSEEDTRKITRLFTERRYPEGATIFSLGDPADSMIIVRTGVVELVFVSDRGTKTILGLLRPGEVFGELLYSEERRCYTAIASEDAVVAVISRECFEEQIAAFPAFAMNFIRFLSRQLAIVKMDIGEVGHTCSYHRLARVLLQLGEKCGEETGTGTRIPIRLTHEDIANLIGTTRETATVQINRFRRLGLVRKEGGNYILNWSGLSRYVHSV